MANRALVSLLLVVAACASATTSRTAQPANARVRLPPDVLIPNEEPEWYLFWLAATNTLNTHQVEDGSTWLGFDEWTGNLAIVARVIGPSLRDEFDFALLVLNTDSPACRASAPDSALVQFHPPSVLERYRIRFIGFGRRVRLLDEPMIGGTGVSVNACGTLEAMRQYVQVDAAEDRAWALQRR